MGSVPPVDNWIDWSFEETESDEESEREIVLRVHEIAQAILADQNEIGNNAPS